ncbi:MAG: hypothetical protein ONA90_10125 [candidate division KSB1 bacterium]|nr:hypothetical protein [candidate division KSB1 bacterium]
MNKRALNKLAKAGYFNSANGALYAALKRGLRKPLKTNYFQIAAESNKEALTRVSASNSAVSTARSRHPSNNK